MINAIIDGRLLIFSAAKPDAGFSAGMAMMRNKFIYSQSLGTVVIKSDYNKGGTWSGAVENLKKPKCLTYCRNIQEYKGNIELISRGAIPIDEEWDAVIPEAGDAAINTVTTPEQTSLFEAVE